MDLVLTQGRVRRTGRFLWPASQIEVVPRGPAPDGPPREIEHVPDEEIVRGMALLLEHAFSLTEDELVTRTARLFGYQRTGADIDRRLRATIRQAERSRWIEAQGERYQLRRK